MDLMVVSRASTARVGGQRPEVFERYLQARTTQTPINCQKESDSKRLSAKRQKTVRQMGR
jgi:hypothetical protein